MRLQNKFEADLDAAFTILLQLYSDQGQSIEEQIPKSLQVRKRWNKQNVTRSYIFKKDA